MNLIRDIKVEKGSITVYANEDFHKRFLRDTFEVNYFDYDENPVEIMEEYALIPFIGNIAPLVWISGEVVEVDELEENFVNSLQEMKKSYSKLHPSFEWNGQIKVRKKVALPGGQTKREQKGAVTLFSGGVDSVYTSLFCGFDNQFLATVRGADIPRDNNKSWHNVMSQSKEHADLFGYNNIYIDSSFARFINTPKIEREYPEIGEWWTAVQHGPGFLTLLSPLTRYYHDVYIASSHTEKFKEPWGSSPGLDNSCFWGPVQSHHHGFEVSRQEKTNKIVEKTKNDTDKPFLRVCGGNAYGAGDNCMWCEKCLRTFAGFTIAGAMPEDYGLKVTVAEGYKRIKSRFKKYTMPMGANQRFMWQDIQENISKLKIKHNKYNMDENRKDFIEWLANFDFDRYYKKAQLPYQVRKKLVKIAKSNQVLEKIVRKGASLNYRLRG